MSLKIHPILNLGRGRGNKRIIDWSHFGRILTATYYIKFHWVNELYPTYHIRKKIQRFGNRVCPILTLEEDEEFLKYISSSSLARQSCVDPGLLQRLQPVVSFIATFPQFLSRSNHPSISVWALQFS
jgi:hypothetical protein